MLTYITTYCDNPEYLTQVLDTMQQCTDERLKLIVVDDCSDVPPVDVINARADNRISLYRITENLGFNSHGGRNLAMKETTTEWNLLVDIDFRVDNIQSMVDQVANQELENHIPHFLSVVSSQLDPSHKAIPMYTSINDFIITKSAFWKVGGYDSEFFGWHHGDRAFLHRALKGHLTTSVIYGSKLFALRSPKAITEIDPDLVGNQERYSEDRTTFFVSPDTAAMIRRQEVIAFERHANGGNTDPIPFQWEQLI